MCDTDKPTAYADLRRVYLIEDGAMHWYVAASAGKALIAHEELMEPDAEQYHIREIDFDMEISLLYEDEQDAKDGLPPSGRIESGLLLGQGGFRATATAAAWALKHRDGMQLASSEY